MLFSAIKRENLSIARSLSSTVIGALVSPAVTRNESLAQGATFVSSLKHGLVKCEIFIFICPRLEEYVYVQEKEVRGEDEVSVECLRHGRAALDTTEREYKQKHERIESREKDHTWDKTNEREQEGKRKISI